MTDQELLIKLRTLFPEYEIELTKDGYIHGSKASEDKKVRFAKDWYIIHNRRLFVSTFMYPGTDRDFKYSTIHTRSKCRRYRCRTWNDYELFKGFTSGKTNQELYDNIAAQFVNIKESF